MVEASFELISDEKIAKFNSDSIALIKAFSQIYNNATGLGTPSDKVMQARINPGVAILNDMELMNLPRNNSLVATMLDLYPNEAMGAWADIDWGKNTTLETSEIWAYMRDLKYKEGETDAKLALRDASSLGRQFGDGFILLGLADGLRLTEPINYDRIRSLEWLKVIEGYRVLTSDDKIWEFEGIKIHRSRFLRFPGRRLVGDAYRFNLYRNDSIFQAAFEDFARFTQGLQAGANMLLDFDLFTFGMQGLGQVIKADVQNKTTKGEEWIKSRSEAINIGKSVARMLLYDLQNEKPDHLNRTYSGAENIMDRLERIWVACSGIPRYKLLNEALAGGLASSTLASAILNFQWATALKRWQEFTWLDPIEKLVKIVLNCRDFSRATAKIQGWAVHFPLAYQVSPYEQMELENLAANRSKTLKELGVFTPYEIRQAYKNPEFSVNLVPLEEFDLMILEASKRGLEAPVIAPNPLNDVEP